MRWAEEIRRIREGPKSRGFILLLFDLVRFH
jgi:hypothetical protein